MPELPEVETTLRGIAPLVVGRRVAVMHMYDHRLRWSVPRWLPARIAGRTVDALDRRSKYLLFRLSTDTLLVHFGMTGSLRAFVAAPPRRPHDHVDIVLDSGVTLRYHDPRRFGAMLWLPGAGRGAPAAARARPRAVRPGLQRRLPLARDAAPHRGDQACADGQSSRRRHWQYLRQRIAVSRRDPPDDPGESRVEGPAGRASWTSFARRSATPSQKGGSTLRDYVDSRGEPGYFQLDYAVYGRRGLPCRRCGAPSARSARAAARPTTARAASGDRAGRRRRDPP